MRVVGWLIRRQPEIGADDSQDPRDSRARDLVVSVANSGSAPLPFVIAPAGMQRPVVTAMGNSARKMPQECGTIASQLFHKLLITKTENNVAWGLHLCCTRVPHPARNSISTPKF
jgi:hypothetical protein